jgi:hypothetical protein
MRLIRFALALAVGFSFAFLAHAEEQKWSTIKGQVIWQGAIPAQPKIKAPAEAQCPAGLQGGLEEDHIVNPKNNGLKDVFVWIRPVGAEKEDRFPVKLINPNRVKPAVPTVVIGQPCCKFIPHVLAAQEGQNLDITNAAPFAHNAKFDSKNSGTFNPLIPSGGKFTVPNPLKFETSEIILQCSIHPWMNARIRIFDHPYFAVTDDDGKFEIKDAPVGKFNIFVNHPATGWLNGKEGRKGQAIEIKEGGTDLGVFKMQAPKAP